MRVISGSLKGRRFDPPTNMTARPTTDFAKEGLFNMLMSNIDLDGIDVLDLFEGTGSVGYEFVSRGAAHVTGVEMNEKQILFIKKTCKDFGINNLLVTRMDVFRYLSAPRKAFDVVFADPPYQLDNLATLPELVLGNGFVKPDGLFILEHGSKNNFADHECFVEERKYGNVHFSLFRPKQ